MPAICSWCDRDPLDADKVEVLVDIALDFQVKRDCLLDSLKKSSSNDRDCVWQPGSAGTEATK